MDLFNQHIIDKAKELFKEIESLSLESKIDAVNNIRKILHQYSPFNREPVDLVQWVRNETVEANDYNPNSVAPPEMKLLEISILEDGYTQPIVTFDEEYQKTVVDGFHRNRVGKESEKVKNRVHGYLPVVVINDDRTDKGDRVASTIRHNRARGEHKVDAMSEIVVDLKRRNWSDEKIARELGMDADEVLRLSQISGIAEMFQDKEFSEAWEVNTIGEDDTLETDHEVNNN